MNELLDKMLEGIDLEDPDASRQLFLRMMGMVDWWGLFWLTVACAVIGGLIGRYKGEMWKGVFLGAALGPIGWVMSLMSKGRKPPPIVDADELPSDAGERRDTFPR